MKFLALFSLFLSGCTLLKDYKEDNFVEEGVEFLIKRKTGADVDFTPKSPENLYQKMINGKM